MKRKEVSKEHYANGCICSILDIWLFKRKRFPDGILLKHKSILCAHGGIQKWGVNYWENYAPVVSWICVHNLLVTTKTNKLKSHSIAFFCITTG